MTYREIRDYVLSICARTVRKLTVRGRAGQGIYSCEGHETAETDPENGVHVKRAGTYGLVSECPDGTEIIAPGINGSSTSRVGVAEIVPGQPTCLPLEVLLWAKAGQRVLLDQDGSTIFNGGTHKIARVGDPVAVTIYYMTSVVSGTVVVTSLSNTHDPGTTPLTLTGTISDNGDVKVLA